MFTKLNIQMWLHFSVEMKNQETIRNIKNYQIRKET